MSHYIESHSIVSYISGLNYFPISSQFLHSSFTVPPHQLVRDPEQDIAIFLWKHIPRTIYWSSGIQYSNYATYKRRLHGINIESGTSIFFWTRITAQGIMAELDDGKIYCDPVRDINLLQIEMEAKLKPSLMSIDKITQKLGTIKGELDAMLQPSQDQIAKIRLHLENKEEAITELQAQNARLVDLNYGLLREKSILNEELESAKCDIRWLTGLIRMTRNLNEEKGAFDGDPTTSPFLHIFAPLFFLLLKPSLPHCSSGDPDL